MKTVYTLCLVSLFLATVGHADEPALASVRSKYRAGLYAGTNSDPFPSKYGLNIAYNMTDCTRFHFGTGLYNEGSTDIMLVGWGFHFMVPDWSSSPTFGLSYAGTVGQGKIKGYADHLYINLGLDFQLENGAYIGVGFNHSITQPKIRVQPYLQIGQFF